MPRFLFGALRIVSGACVCIAHKNQIKSQVGIAGQGAGAPGIANCMQVIPCALVTVRVPMGPSADALGAQSGVPEVLDGVFCSPWQPLCHLGPVAAHERMALCQQEFLLRRPVAPVWVNKPQPASAQHIRNAVYNDTKDAELWQPLSRPH